MDAREKEEICSVIREMFMNVNDYIPANDEVLKDWIKAIKGASREIERVQREYER